MLCDRCKKEIPFIKPINTCNVVRQDTYQWTTYVLCNECFDKLEQFLGEKESNIPDPSVWYPESVLGESLEGCGTDA